MKIKTLNGIKNKRQINSERAYNPSDIIPDAVNRETCLTCSKKVCKGKCEQIKKRGENY